MERRQHRFRPRQVHTTRRLDSKRRKTWCPADNLQQQPILHYGERGSFFGKEDENVRRRIEIFNTESQLETLPGIDRWIYDNAMHCVAWIVDELNTIFNHHHIPRHELWYECCEVTEMTTFDTEGEKLYDSVQVSSISTSDIRDLECDDEPRAQVPTNHQCSEKEVRCRRLRSKRKAAHHQTPVPSDE